MESIIIIVFVLGYLAITLEHNLKLDKLIPALIMMADSGYRGPDVSVTLVCGDKTVKDYDKKLTF